MRRIRHGQIPLWLVIVISVGLLAALITWTIYSTREQSPDGRKPIVVWAGAVDAAFYTIINQFEQQNPEYKVIISSSATRDPTADGQRLLCAISGDVPPDLVNLDRFAIGEWAARGALEDLTPYIQHQDPKDPNYLNLDDYYGFLLDEVSYSPPGSNLPKRLYGIPTGMDVRMLICNNNLLRQEGLVDPKTGEPRPPQTWDELRDDAKRLTRYDEHGQITRLGFGPNFGNSWLYIYVFEAGGNLLSADGTRITMDSPPVVRALRFMTDIYDDLGGAAQVDGFQTSFQADSLDPFLLGQVAMKIDAPGGVNAIADYKPDMDFSVTAAPMPADELAKGRKPTTWAGGWSWVIPSTAHQKEGAFKLIQFLRSERMLRFMEEGIREFRESQGKIYLPGGQPNRKVFNGLVRDYVTNNPRMPAGFKQMYAEMLELLPNTKIRPPTPVGQKLWVQQVRAYDAAINHHFAAQARNKDDEMRLCLSTMQEPVQQDLDRILHPPLSKPVNWSPYFGFYGLVMALPFVAMYVAYRRHRRVYSYQPREIGASLLFVSPWMIGILGFGAGPILFSIVLSFTRYDVLSPAHYVGIDNYTELLRDPVFYKSLANTAFMIIGIPLGMTASLAIALLLNRSIRGIGAYRTMFYMPAIVPAVAGSLLWLYLLNPNTGAINIFLDWLLNTAPFHGLEHWINHLHHFESGPFKFSAPSWLNDANWSKPGLIFMSLWGAGGGMIIWLAGLQSVPRQLYEAATVDGASPWQQFVHVTLPMLSPYILFNLIIGLIGTMQIFTQAYLITQGGPDDSTLFYAYYLFREAFQFFNMGYASALAWILFLIVLVLTLIQLWLSTKWVSYDRS